MSAEEQQHQILTHKLAVLLGFDDGAADVLTHLLTIESRADLLDYLTQLLGSDRIDQLRDFVDDVGRVQRDESLLAVVSEDDAEKKKAPVKQAVPLVTLTRKTAPPLKPAPPAEMAKKVPASTARQPAVPVRANRPPAAKMSNQDKKNNTVGLAMQQIKEASQPIKPKLPSKGKAAVECGCFGSLHPALTNCLFCGRISCEREGLDYCPFCGNLVVEQARNGGDAAAAASEAWRHKERLLSYDRESAQRTVVLDDQADYYSNSTSAWLTEDEQTEAATLEQQRQDEIHKRKKMQIDLAP